MICVGARNHLVPCAKIPAGAESAGAATDLHRYFAQLSITLHDKRHAISRPDELCYIERDRPRLGSGADELFIEIEFSRARDGIANQPDPLAGIRQSRLAKGAHMGSTNPIR